MPGWAGSSWYYLRYMDPHNDKEFVSKAATDYWKDVDFYLGGSEHATGHLLYVRFWTKFLKDRGFISIEEPANKLVNQGMIQGVSAKVRLGIYLDDNSNQKQVLLPFNYPNIADEHYTPAINYPIQYLEWASYDGKNYYLLNENKHLEAKKTHHYLENVEFYSKDSVNMFFKQLPKASDFGLESDGEIDNGLMHNNFVRDYDEQGGMLLNPEVEKMSKSKWNVVNPDELVEKFGADTLRMYEMFLGPLEQSKPWNTNGITGVSGFLKKFWKLYQNVSEEKASQAELKVLHKTIKKITDDIEKLSFNTCVSTFMICVNELTDLKCNKREILEPLVVLIAPLAPHIAEELWNKFGHTESVTFTKWPEYKEEHTVENSFSYPVSFNGKTRFFHELDTALSKEDVEKEVMALEQTQKYLEGKQPKKVIVVHKKIVNIVV